jgi:hypothetical protein
MKTQKELLLRGVETFSERRGHTTAWRKGDSFMKRRKKSNIK